MKISNFNINRSKSNYSFKNVSYVADGLMSTEDYINLHSIEDMSGKNIEQINITEPDMTIISPKITEAKQKLSEQNDKLNQIYYLTESQGYCGRVWDESSASPTAKTYCGNLTMLQQLPELLGLGGYLVQNDHTRRKLSPENHYFFEDGSEAKLDGSIGHYQWGWNKPFYITTWNENNLFYECISFEPIKSRASYYVPIGSMSCSGHATMDRETNTLVSYCNNSTRYRGGNNNSEWDNDSEKTLLGRCVTNLTITEFAEAAHKNGTGWYAGTMRMHSVLTILFHIIMGTRDSQADFNPVKNSDGLYECGLGAGICGLFDISWNVWQTYNQSNPFLSMNELANLGNFTGVSDTKFITYKNDNNENITDSYTIPVFFGLKNPFSYIWSVDEDEFARSILNTGVIHYIRKSMYSDDYVYGTINDAVIKGSVAPIINEYIKDISYDNLELWIVSCDNSSSNTYYCDKLYSYVSFTNYRIVFRGGCAYYDKNEVGLAITHTRYTLDHYTNALSTYLCEFTEDFLLEPICE